MLKSVGTFAQRPANPLAGDEYTATDTSQKFTCFVDGTWVEAMGTTPTDNLVGYGMTYVSASSVTVGKASFDSSARDSTNAFSIDKTGTITVDLTSSGAGGLDTGAEAADTHYYVYVIGDSTGVNAADAVFSASSSSPTLPGTHDVFRLVGAVRNDSSSNIIEFTQTGNGRDRRIRYSNLTRLSRRVLSAGSAQTPTAVDCSSCVPSNIIAIDLDFIENGSFDFTTHRSVADSDFAFVYTDSSSHCNDHPCTSDVQIAYDFLGAGGSGFIDVRGYLHNL